MADRTTGNELHEIAQRIREMREIIGYTQKQAAELTEVSEETYRQYEQGTLDFPFSFMHKCAMAFGVELTELLEGSNAAKLSGYTVTRRGKGPVTAREEGITIQNMAAMFRDKLATPYWVTYEYDAALQNQPIHTSTHGGQEFDLVISGAMRVRVGDKEELLREGDSIFYKSSTPHGMIAVDGKDCTFLAMIMATSDREQRLPQLQTLPEHESAPELCRRFVQPEEYPDGRLKGMHFAHADEYNFAFDTVDGIARKDPEKLAMIHVSNDFTERRFTFKDMKDASSQTANYFKSLGIKRGDRVMLVLKRHYQFWFCILALHKLGAIAVPATNQLVEHDFEYRFKTGHINAIVCTGDGDTAHQVELGEKAAGMQVIKIMAHGTREGWHRYDEEYPLFSRRFERAADAPCGDDPMLMFFTSGTSGYPKMALHSYKYALGHYVTAKYWHMAERNGLHFTISETGWGKALWGKLYGQWLCEGAVFTYDFDRFDAAKILPMFKKYNITTFCAPPTMYRMLIKQDLSGYDLSSIHHATTAGEALNPEVFYQFEKATGLQIAEGFGQTEMTLGIGNLVGEPIKPGSMGKPIPSYGIDIVDQDGNPVDDGVNGEIVIHTEGRHTEQCGVFLGYYLDEEKTAAAWHDNLYHTGDVAWRDEDGYYWYVGRADDVIKSSGYRIGPFEIENVIMELPYVLECGVSAAPDEVRGQVVKASIVLVPGTEGTDELKKEIQNYVKSHTAPYKYPRIVEFKKELPKTISGKIQRNKL